jgi:hypothetical protein
MGRLFWAQMALAALVPFKGPKKSRFLGPHPPKMPRVMDSPPSKPLRTAPYKQQVHWLFYVPAYAYAYAYAYVCIMQYAL